MLRQPPLLKYVCGGLIFVISYAVFSRLIALVFVSTMDFTGLPGLAFAFLVSSLVESTGFAAAVAASIVALKFLKAPSYIVGGLTGGALAYTVISIFGPFVDSPHILLPLTALASIVCYVAGYIVARLPLLQTKNGSVVFLMLLGLFILFIVPPVAKSARNTAYLNSISPENQYRSSLSEMTFQSYSVPPTTPSVTKVKNYVQDFSNTLDSESGAFTRIDLNGPGYSMSIHESERFTNFSKLVSPPNLCNLDRLHSVVSQKASVGYHTWEEFSEIDTVRSSCRVVGTTANGRTIYGESNPEDSDPVESYYFVEIKGTIIAIKYRAFGVSDQGRSELLQIVEALQPIDKSDLEAV